jgi:hypothetical protein
MFFKLGRQQAWIERTKNTEWKPVVESEGGSLEVWFLRFHVILDRA